MMDRTSYTPMPTTFSEELLLWRINRKMVRGKLRNPTRASRQRARVAAIADRLSRPPIDSYIELGKCWQLIAELSLGCGDIDEYFAACEVAIAHYEADGGRSDEYGNFLHDLAVTWSELGRPDQSRIYLEQSRGIA